MPKPTAPRKYFARLDARNRLTLRGAAHEAFRVEMRADGSFLAKPVAIVPAVSTSPRPRTGGSAGKR